MNKEIDSIIKKLYEENGKNYCNNKLRIIIRT